MERIIIKEKQTHIKPICFSIENEKENIETNETIGVSKTPVASISLSSTQKYHNLQDIWSEIEDLALSSNEQYEAVMQSLLKIKANTFLLSTPVITKPVANGKVFTTVPVGVPMEW